MPVSTSLAAAALAAAATAATVTPPPAAAPRPVPAWEMTASADVEARATVILEDPLKVSRPLPTDARKLEGLRIMEQRLRAGTEIGWERSRGVLNEVKLNVQADAFNGPSARGSAGATDADKPSGNPEFASTSQLLAVDPEFTRSLELGAGDKFILRQFSVEATARWGRVLAGRTVSQWGLGLLAQDGVDDPLQFGFKRRGTVVDRIQAVVIPGAIPGDGTWAGVFPIAIAVAADNVVDDDLAEIRKGEDATNVIIAAVLKLDHLDAGLYGVSRKQVDARGLRIDATVADVFARWHQRFGKYKVELATEWLTISGDTTYFRTASNPDVLKVDQLGGVMRGTIERGKFSLRLEGGVASADQNAFDDTVRNFKFARDYRVGLVLFSDVMRRSSSNTAASLSDPRFSGQPPAGYERLSTGGAVSQAIYLHPVLRVGPFYGLSAMAGYVWARSPSKLVDPYKSSLQGGAAIGPNGGAASDDLGTELDFSVQYRTRFGPLALIARADWGCATLGTAWADESGAVGDGICTVIGQLQARARW